MKPSIPLDYRRHLALQTAAALSVLFLALPYFSIRGEPLPWRGVSVAIGCMALLYSCVSRHPWWWRTIHATFAPMAWMASSLAIDPGWFLAAFILTLAVFRGALEGRIPLYTSNKATALALGKVIEDQHGVHFIDLGAGLGSVVSRLARLGPDLPSLRVTGIENAPMTWLIGRLRTLRQPNCDWRWGDLWHVDLSRFDVVYAFLSPSPMPELWSKVAVEMRPGTILISNTFTVPGRNADKVIAVDDARQTRLYCYYIPSITDESRCAPRPPSPGSDS